MLILLASPRTGLQGQTHSHDVRISRSRHAQWALQLSVPSLSELYARSVRGHAALTPPSQPSFLGCLSHRDGETCLKARRWALAFSCYSGTESSPSPATQRS